MRSLDDLRVDVSLLKKNLQSSTAQTSSTEAVCPPTMKKRPECDIPVGDTAENAKHDQSVESMAEADDSVVTVDENVDDCTSPMSLN